MYTNTIEQVCLSRDVSVRDNKQIRIIVTVCTISSQAVMPTRTAAPVVCSVCMCHCQQ